VDPERRQEANKGGDGRLPARLQRERAQMIAVQVEQR